MERRIPFAISVFSLFLGVFISVLFGINEDIFKGKIAKDLKKNEKIMSILDPATQKAKIEKEKSKNWRYYQRFHFHSTGIGAMTIGLLLLLQLMSQFTKVHLVTSYSLSISGFLYPFIWLFAGMYGPIMGRSEAKSAFAIFGYMGGVYLLSLGVVLFLVLKYPLKKLN